MSLTDCLNQKLEQGIIDGERADELVEKYEEAIERRGDDVNEILGKQEAAEEALEQLKFHKIQKKRQELLHAQTLTERVQDMLGYRDAMGQETPGHALTAMIDFDPQTKADFPNISARSKSNLRKYRNAFLEGIEEAERKGGFDRTDKTSMRETVRALFGESESSTAKMVADQFKKVADRAFNEARLRGATIARREDWNLPNFMFDRGSVRTVEYDEFAADMMEALDLERVKETVIKEKGGAQSIDDLLKTAYENISTNGALSDFSPGDSGKIFADKLSSQRVFQYEDAQSWIDMHEKYGEGNIFETMVGYLDKRARSNAVMDVFGPKPKVMKEQLKDLAEKRAGELSNEGEETRRYLGVIGGLGDNDPVDVARNQIEFADRIFDVVAGENQSNAAKNVSGFLDVLKNTATGVFLQGTEILASVTDMNYSRMGALHNGLSATKVLKRQVKNMAPFVGEEDQKLARRSRLITNAVIGQEHNDSRFLGWYKGTGESFARNVLKYSLLTRGTRKRRIGFNLEYMGNLADLSDRSWSELKSDGKGQAFRESLERYGVTKYEWNNGIKGAGLERNEGVDFFEPEKNIRTDKLTKTEARELGNKIHEAILTEQDVAIPSTSTRAQVTLGRDNRGIMGKVVELGTQFLTFPVTMHQTHIQRMIANKGMTNYTSNGSLNFAANVADHVVSTTAAASMVVLMEDALTEGKDPIDVTNNPKKFFMRSLARGGGLALWGDVIFGHDSLFRGNPEEMFSFPAMSITGDVSRLGGQVLGGMAGQRDAEPAKAVHDFVNRYHPVPWYGELAFERLMTNQMYKASSTGAARDFMDDINFNRRQRGQDYWWEPGDPAPDRTPDVSNVAGE